MKILLLKKSYKKLLLFEVLIFILLTICNAFEFLLLDYSMVLFIGLLLVAFRFTFGLEKNKNYLTKEILLDIVIFLLVYFILFYLTGIPMGFAETGHLSFKMIYARILPLAISICLTEMLRSLILIKSGNNIVLKVTTCILFTYINIVNVISMGVLTGSMSFFLFLSLSLLPSITSNILCTYMSCNFGYKPCILFLLVMNLYVYLLPIVPNPNEYIKALLDFLVPIILLLQVRKSVLKDKDEILDTDYRKESGPVLLVPMAITLVLVYFISGYFKYYAIAIATGSMEPKIHVGDVVVVNQEIDTKKVEVGDVIAFKTNDSILVHRIYNIIDYNDELFIYTKGDNNESVDPWVIKEEDIIGELSFKVNWVGLPTIWVNEALERDK